MAKRKSAEGYPASGVPSTGDGYTGSKKGKKAKVTGKVAGKSLLGRFIRRGRHTR